MFLKPSEMTHRMYGTGPTARIWHRCETRVLYADTDRSGLVYHSNYFRFFELGRATLMRDTPYPLMRFFATTRRMISLVPS